MNAPLSETRKRTYHSLAALALALFAIAGLSGCNKLKARDKLAQGVQAYKNGQYDHAIEDFQEAIKLDPSLTVAQLYLATAYQTQYIPAAPSEENKRMADEAIKQYDDILSRDPNNLSAIDNMGSLLYNMAGTPFSPETFEKSKQFHMKHIELNPNDAEPYYWVGLIDWTLTWHANQQLRSDYNHAHPTKQIHDDQPLPPDLRDQYAAKNSAMVEDGISSMKKAMDRRADYDDAMAYLSLLYRQKGDMTANPSERDDLLRQADALLDQVKQIKQKKASAAQSNS
ncbi:MAG: tetratricopeptide repeat protein [Candidatus Acidiferrales bacterium]